MNIYDEFTIAEYWVPAIEYGVMDGLEECEIRVLREFLARLPTGHWDWGEDLVFARDAIGGLKADCVVARYVSG